MSTQPCRSCGKNVHKYAEKCLHCGCKYPTKDSANLMFLYTIIACVVVYCLLYI